MHHAKSYIEWEDDWSGMPWLVGRCGVSCVVSGGLLLLAPSFWCESALRDSISSRPRGHVTQQIFTYPVASQKCCSGPNTGHWGQDGDVFGT